jgi:hypothetical protein
MEQENIPKQVLEEIKKVWLEYQALKIELQRSMKRLKALPVIICVVVY